MIANSVTAHFFYWFLFAGVFITLNQVLSEAKIQLYTPWRLCQCKQNTGGGKHGGS